ncbi:MAG: CAP domain-containing protein [Verrucomicrobiae bacterium]|nr:CAP domain-containing protein [Verrucomicrobiae bacterium]
MIHPLFLTCLFALFLSTTVFGSMPPLPSVSGVLGEINRVRAENRRPPLKPDPALNRYAAEWADTIAREGKLRHRTNDDLKAMMKAGGYRGLSENIAFSSRAWTARQIVEQWMESDGHRENLLRESTTVCGLGLSTRNGKNYAVFNGASEAGAVTSGN